MQGLRVPGFLRRFWSDVRDSTDASVLGILRVFGLLYGRIDRSLPVDQAFKKAMRHRLPRYVGWRHAFGGISYLLFMVLVGTGVLLALYYRPSTEEAYQSIQYLVSEAPFGWLIRDVHVWSANLIVIAILAHMARVFFSGAYKPPRETSWVVGLLLLLVVIAFGTTGYILPWDQWAYWTTSEVLTALGGVPIVGRPLAAALTADDYVSGATLNRAFAAHVMVLPWIAFGLLSLHFVVVRRHGIAPPADARAPGPEEEGIPFYPTHMIRSLVVTALTLAFVVSLASLFPRPVGDPATPFEVPDHIVSTWIVTDVRLAVLRYSGIGGLFAFAALALLLALLPLFDRGPETRLRHRPLAATLGLLFFVGFLIAWIAGRSIHALPAEVGISRQVLEEREVPAPPPAAQMEGAVRPEGDAE